MTDGMKTFLGAVGIATLFIGGIGVMNVMLVAVRERTREIGVRKAVGATRRSVVRQFFIETLIVVFASGGVGLAIAYALCALVNLLPMPHVLRRPAAHLAVGGHRLRAARHHRPLVRGLSREPRRRRRSHRGAALRGRRLMLREVLVQAWDALGRNRVRSALTMLGIVWGIIAVTVLMAYGSGFRGALVHAFEAFGKSAVVAWPGQTSEQAGGERAGKPVKIEKADMEAVRAEATMVKALSMETVKRYGVS